MEKLKDELFVAHQKLFEKENMLSLVMKENEKYSQGTLKIKEIFITEPTKLNNELNNEVNYARDIMSKVSKLMNIEKRKNEKLEKINTEKNSEINLLKKKMLEIMEVNKDNNKFKYNKNENNLNLNNNKYNDNNNSDYERINEKDGRRLSTKNFNRDNKEIDDKIILDKDYVDSFSDISSELESLSSTSNSQKSENSIDVNFPEKVKMNEKNKHHKSISLIPKLDFTKVNEKYNNESMKKINLAQNKISIKNLKREENDSEFKKLKKENDKNIEKLKKYKERYNKLKDKYKNIKSLLKISNGRIDVLEMHIKRNTTLVSTEDITNKRSEQIENTSMVNFLLIYIFF